MRHRGFTLVELLITSLLGAVAVLVVLGIARQSTMVMERIATRTLAWERGQNALSIIEPRAIHAAFGITFQQTGDVFRRSFGRNNVSSPPPARWTDRGPVQIWDGFPSLFNLAPNQGGVFRGRGIALLYAIPSALRAYIADNTPIALNEGQSANVRLIPSPAPGYISNRLSTHAKNDLRSWVTFPLMRIPVHAAYAGGSITVSMAEASGLSATIYPFDEMHYLRASRFYAQNEIMFSEELRTAWTHVEARLEGVLEMWFEWTPSKNLLEAWILTTGGGISSGRSTRPADWPLEAPWRASFERHSVLVTRGAWILRNM